MRIRASKITNLVYFGVTQGVQQSVKIPELGKAPRGRSSEFARVSGWFYYLLLGLQMDLMFSETRTQIFRA